MALTPSPRQGIDFFNVESMEMAQRTCKLFTNSELVPQQYSAAKVGAEKAVANTLIALDMSSRTGASPLMIMQNLYIVQGRPSFSSAFLISCINTSGRFDTLKYKMGVDDKNPAKTKDGRQIPNMWCYAYTWEKGQAGNPDLCLKSTLITMQMAIDEGWYTKPGSKWLTMPSQMLKYRAAAFWCRAFAPEISMGMHTTEEISDGIIEDVEFTEVEAPIEETPAPTDSPLASTLANLKSKTEKVDEETGEVTE